MALGDYRFSIDSAAFDVRRLEHAYRWVSQARLQQRPLHQFIGEGEQSIELNGVIYPHHRGGLAQLDQFRSEAGKGEPLLLTDGTGRVWGQWIVIQITEEAMFFTQNGLPLKQTFSLQLKRYD